MYDIVVIGAGPGGYVAAIRAAQLGFKTAIIEKEHLGGVCLNWGCIPTKALLKSAEIKRMIDHAHEYGIVVSNVEFDLSKIIERSRKVASNLSAGIKGLLKKNKVTLIEGHATLLGKGKIEVATKDGKKETLSSKHIILSTGARSRTLPFIPKEHPRVWFAKEAMTPQFMPKSLVILGSGAIGIEFANFYKALGAHVHVVEMQDRILPQEDAEISNLAEKSFKKQGIEFSLGHSATDVKAHESHVEVIIKDKNDKVNTLKADAVIVAIGIIGNTENLGLENTSVKVEKGQIIIDHEFKTHEPFVYAIGDVAGAPWLAHKASHEGILCAEKIAGKSNHGMNREKIPACTYSLPQIASIGLTEEKAKEKGFEIKVGRFAYKANGKAQALGETEGLIKTIFEANTGELLGAHMIGAEVTELIQGFAIAKTLEATEEDLLHTIFPHPTLSEMMHESVLDALGRVIHS